jgi:deoxyribodipyrimidine photo-lyase
MHPFSFHWFRNDLRIEDNPALSFAANQGKPLVGIYIFEDHENTVQKLWLHASLKALETSLNDLKIPLIMIEGPALEAWKKLLKHYPIEHVSWSTCYEPAGIKRDEQVAKLLAEHRIAVFQANGTHLLDPTALVAGSGNFYKVFTPYWNMHQKVYEIPEPVPRLKGNAARPHIEELPRPRGRFFDDLKRWGSLRRLPPPEQIVRLDLPLKGQDCDERIVQPSQIPHLKNPLIELGRTWEPGEKGAHKRLKHFVHHSLAHYEKGRDYPALEAHSGLSPHLHFGEISPHTLVRSCHNKSFIRELVFRDFAMQLLYHIPTLPDEPMKPQFSKWKWDNDSSFFEAWKKGKTGYPIVDAGMRELLETGFMHNRVRMIVASFLVKDLNIAWQKGADWFLKRLLDADLANNSFNWQWSAGTGPDAQPFFRIFNPLLQSKKFDPEGIYIKKWVPELRNLSSKALHTPIDPIVDHDIAKKAAMKEFKRVS